MDEKLLKKLLHERQEQDWFDFKGKLKLYQADGKLVDRQRDELLKDILGLANGNSRIVRKTKYLIIGADDKKFDENGMRILYDVDYAVPSQSDLAKWLKDACSPAVVGLDCEKVTFQEHNLFIISIPPTFDLHETTRELITSNATFQKYTVFMRQDEHTVPASVRDGLTIQQLKHLFRQEIANPPSIWVGTITGGIVAFILSKTLAESLQTTPRISEAFARTIVTGVGILFGNQIGWYAKLFNETRYDWRYMDTSTRIRFVLGLLVLVIVLFFIFTFQK